jgi:hypothetical protein
MYLVDYCCCIVILNYHLIDRGSKCVYSFSLSLFSKFPIFNRYNIYRTAILALYVKVINIPKGVRSEVSIFSAFLTIYEGHRRNIQKVLYQGR